VFDQYSDRARTIVFVTRYRSGKDGAPALDTDHLIEAIIFEDQGKLADALDEETLLSPVFEPKPHFFSAEIASELLLKIQQLLPGREPIPTSVDMPVSSDLKRIFAAATALVAELHQEQVEPLHLLAAAMSEQSEATKLLTAIGISRDQIIMALKAGSKPS
jgi:ATP-dependent Clp protease ATP-binding subunit ClpA